MANFTFFIRQRLHGATQAFILGWLLLVSSFSISVSQAQGPVTAPEPFVSAADVAPALETARGDIARIRAAHGQLNPQLAYAPLGNERDVLTEKFVAKLNRIAYSPLSTPAQRREAIQLWFDLYTASRDWKPSLTVNIRNVNPLRQAVWNLALAARGPDGKAEAKQALLWLIPLMNFGSDDSNGQWRVPHAKVVLATPEALPEVREWALSVLSGNRAAGTTEERIGYYRELVAMPHLSPDERGRHLMSYGYFLQSSGRKEEAKQLFSEMRRDEKLPLKERSSAYLILFNEAMGADKIKIADDALKLFAGPGDQRDNWLSWRAGALRDNRQNAEAIAAFDVLAALESAKPATRAYARLEAAKLRYAAPETKAAGREALLQLITDKALNNATSQMETANLLAKEAFDAKDYAAAVTPLERALLIPNLADTTRYGVRFDLANALMGDKKYIEALAQIEQIPVRKPLPAFESQFLAGLFERARRDKDQPGAQAALDLMQKRGFGEGDLKLRAALLKEDANDWAAALAIYRELLPKLQREADRKMIQDAIARVEAKINP